MLNQYKEIEQLGRPKTKFGRALAAMFTGGASEIVYKVQDRKAADAANKSRIFAIQAKAAEAAKQAALVKMQNEEIKQLEILKNKQRLEKLRYDTRPQPQIKETGYNFTNKQKMLAAAGAGTLLLLLAKS